MLKPEHFSYKCPLQLSDLNKTDDGHFCAKCSKDIYDLSDCSIDEIIELQRRKGSICGFVRAIGVTSMVGLAACSKSGKEAANGAASDTDAKPVIEQPEIMGEICIPDQGAPKPEEAKPEKTPQEDGSTVGTGGEQPKKPEKPEIIEVEGPPIEGPVLMGIICPPDQLKPQDPKPLDPHREGSPG